MEKGKIVIIKATGVKAEIVQDKTVWNDLIKIECLTTSKQQIIHKSEVQLYKLTGVL